MRSSPSGYRELVCLLVGARCSPEGQEWSGALERGLQELGWIQGKTALIDYRWQTSDLHQRTVFVNEIIALRPDILRPALKWKVPVVAARNATRTVPIVFVAVADPVAQGFVASLAQPGGIRSPGSDSKSPLWARSGSNC